MTRVAIRPEMLRWARERAGVEGDSLAQRIPQLPDWERGEKQPTLKQLEKFAKATRTPIGFLFLPEPFVERIPIPDFRTVSGAKPHPSPDLLDTIYAMQRRQDWLREERLECEAEPLSMVGSARISDEPTAVGQEMRRIAGIADGWATEVRNWEKAGAAPAGR